MYDFNKYLRNFYYGGTPFAAHNNHRVILIKNNSQKFKDQIEGWISDYRDSMGLYETSFIIIEGVGKQ